MNFNFGNKKPTIVQYAVIGVILSSLVGGLSQCTHISENRIWDLLDEVQRRYLPQTIINDFIIKDPERLNRRIHRDVDRAIDSYNAEYDKMFPRKINMKNENILKELQKSKYTYTQRLIVENAEYYEFPPDGSEAQGLLGGTMGIKSKYE